MLSEVSMAVAADARREGGQVAHWIGRAHLLCCWQPPLCSPWLLAFLDAFCYSLYKSDRCVREP